MQMSNNKVKMDNAILIKVNSPDTLHFLYEMQEMNMVKVLKDYADLSAKPKLSDKFRGTFSKEAGKSFMEHTKASREEWRLLL